MQAVEPEHTLLIQAEEAWANARGEPRLARLAAEGVLRRAGGGDVEARIVALRTIGWVDRVLFAHASARASLDRAARLARRHELAGRHAQVLVTRAGLRLEYGAFAAAARDLDTARTLVPPDGVAEVEAQCGVMWAKRGDVARAVEHMRVARASLGGADDAALRFMVHNNLGMALVLMGRAEEADAVLRQGEPAARRLGPLAHGTIEQTRALAAVRAGRLRDALERFEAAAELIRGTEWPVGEAFLERIDAYADLRLVAEAEDAARRALRELRAPGGAMLRADALLRAAHVLAIDGRLDDALTHASGAAELYRRQRRPVLRALAEATAIDARDRSGKHRDDDGTRARAAARVLERAGLTGEAVDALLLAARIDDRAGSRRRLLARAADLAATGPVLVRLRGHRARAAAAESTVDALAAARRGLDELARFRAALPTVELRARASAHGAELARIALRRLIVDGTPRRLFEWIERGRLASALVQAPGGGDDVVAADLARLREIQARAASADERDRVEQARLERRIEQRLRRMPAGGALAARSARAGAVARALPPDALFVSAVDIDGELVGVSVGDRVRTVRFGAAAAVAARRDEILFGLRRLTRARSAAARAAAATGVHASLAALDAQFAVPLRAELEGRTAVVIAPPPELLGVPWHALASLTAHEVAVAPSATLWLRARTGDRSSGATVLVAGPDLAGAEDEVGRIARFHTDPIVMTGSTATPDGVRATLEGAALVHLACHGRFRADNPTFSSLRLDRGDLTVLDLEQLRAAPAIMVLAACDIGASTSMPGEELRGVLTSTMSRGTRALVASGVPVADVDTVALMEAFHGELARGASVGSALRRASAERPQDDPAGVVGRIAFACYGDGAARLVDPPPGVHRATPASVR